MNNVRGSNILATLLCAALLSMFTVCYQIDFMGLHWYETVQWERTQQVIHGQSGTPWQYRLFTEGLVYATVRAFQALHFDRPIGDAFLLIRFCQNFLAFGLAVAFYRKLGLRLGEALFGIAFLAWGMCHSLYDGDLTFNTYTDLSLFLTAGLLLLHGKIRWLIPLMLIAPFNRETSGCIPFMLLFGCIFTQTDKSRYKETIWTFVICVGLWLIIVGGLRLVYGVRPYIVPTAGKHPILPLLLFNLTWWRTWVFLFATLGLMPLLALASWKAWPRPLKAFFWAIVPVWFPVHFALAHAPETRLFLVPQLLIFIPGALFGLRYWMATSTAAAPPAAPAPDA